MKAYECDHCGKILTPAESDQTFTIKIKKTGIKKTGMPEDYYNAVKCHVCDQCLETIADYLGVTKFTC